MPLHYLAHQTEDADFMWIWVLVAVTHLKDCAEMEQDTYKKSG